MAKKKPPCAIVESLAVDVPPGRAWEALTSARVLGDIVLGHVEMDPQPGKTFAWQWGVWAAAAPAQGDFTWRGTVVDAVPGSTLVMSGDAMTVVFTVKGKGESSLITVVQGSVAPRAHAEEFQYGWADFLLKLKTHLERPPYEDAVFLRALIRGKPAQILQAWLSPAAMSKILPGKAKIQARAGGRFEWEWKARKDVKNSGALLEIVKGHRVSFTWDGGGRPAEVRLSAAGTPWGALVSLEQLGRPSAYRDNEGQRRMWAHLLERLRVYFFYGKKIRTS